MLSGQGFSPDSNCDGFMAHHVDNIQLLLNVDDADDCRPAMHVVGLEKRDHAREPQQVLRPLYN